MEPETRFQALRGAAGAKPPQCEKSRRGGSQVPFLTGWLFISVKSFWNKSWARPVPAAAVTPAALVVAVFIGPKASVAGLISLW